MSIDYIKSYEEDMERAIKSYKRENVTTSQKLTYLKNLNIVTNALIKEYSEKLEETK